MKAHYHEAEIEQIREDRRNLPYIRAAGRAFTRLVHVHRLLGFSGISALEMTLFSARMADRFSPVKRYHVLNAECERLLAQP